MATRGRPPGQPKTGGRVAGKSLDRQARSLVSAELAGSILATFEKLGGTADMIRWAKENRSIFYTQILSRLMPAPQKDDPDLQINQQFNVGNISDFEAARRVAFCLSKAVFESNLVPVAGVTPQDHWPPWQPPSDMPDLSYEAAMAPDPEPQAREASLETYISSSGGGEQGGSTRHSTKAKDPRSEQRDRLLAARRAKLL